MIAGAPAVDEPVPPSVARVVAGRPARCVWRNELGGLTYEVDPGPRRWFVKWSPDGVGSHLAAEAERLRWAEAFTAVPRVLDLLQTQDGAVLVTAGVPGDNAVSPRWTADPRTAVRAVGAGLRALHDALPVDGCPFRWEAAERVTWVREHRGQNAITGAPPDDVRVVCHGDACAPNTLLTEDGRWSAHVDLGSLGTADRWADIAVATWSTQWNYGPGWERELLDAYGVDADHERTAYYRRLWDLGP